MQSSHSESNILHPAIKASSISSKSFEMLLLQTVNKNAVAKKKGKERMLVLKRLQMNVNSGSKKEK